MEQEKQQPKIEDANASQSQVFGQGGDMMAMLLPMLAGGGVSQDAIFKMLAQNNPRFSGIMRILPMLEKMPKPQSKSQTAKTNYVKIADYYKK